MTDKMVFFEARQPAALLKHELLVQYATPFVAKVGSTAPAGRVVVLDLYAGPGTYEDGTLGSPLLLAGIAAKFPMRKVDLLLVERDSGNYERLLVALESAGVELDHAPMKGDAHTALPYFLGVAGVAPLLVFVDPYGLGVTFDDLVAQVMNRNGGAPQPATEVILNLSSEAIRRIAGRLKEPSGAPGRDATLARLDAACGGDWWRALAASNPADLGETVAEEYLHRICAAAGCAGWSIPVRRAPGMQSVYNLIYLTRHLDGMHLFGEAASISTERWRGAVIGTGTLDDDAFAVAAEEALTNEWLEEIERSIRTTLSTQPTINLGTEMQKAYGGALGLARQKHLRQVLRKLYAAGEITPEPKGDLWKITVLRTS